MELALLEPQCESDQTEIDEKMQEFQFGVEMYLTLPQEQQAELQGALEDIKDIYPLLRVDSPISQEGDRTERRVAFKENIDRLECALETMAKFFPEEVPTFHKFTKGMYIREVHVPAGVIFTSMTHKTQHPFVISKGVCDICNEVGEVQRYAAPHTGITEPGTRRVFLVQEDLVLTTFHATDITDPDEWVVKNTVCENEKLSPTVVLKCFTNTKKELSCPQ
jgi:hypothetical protein